MKLEIQNLSKSYGNIQALKNVNLTLENGVYALLGPNGAGKSTLIHLLTDNLKRDSGKILLDKREILEQGKGYRSLLGYMPQQQGYYEDFSAEAFLIYMAQLKGMCKKDAKQAAQRMLKIVNMESYAMESMRSFSGGMKQRVLLAQALINDPKILILDEPTAGVDPQERIRIRNFISEIAKDKIVVLATHIVSDVESIAKEIILLKKGEVIEMGTPYQLIENIQKYVFELDIINQQLQEIQKNYVISNLRQTAKGLTVKIITENSPTGFTAKCKMANLEDVYLYYFGA